jgi:hypothetical protein
MQPNQFLWDEKFKWTYEHYPISSVRHAIIESIVDYGTTGTYDLSKFPISKTERSEVECILRPIRESIDATKARYLRAVENGRKGGLKGGKIAGRGRPKKQESDGLA